MQLTIEVSADIAEKLKTLEQRVNCSMAPKIEREFQRPVSIEQVVVALVKMGLSGSSRGRISFKRDKITFGVMVAQQQIANSKGTVIYKKSEETRTPKNGDGEK